MNIYLTILLVFILLLIIYWLYKKYTTNKENKQNKLLSSLIEAIKNHITITLYNMQQFINISNKMKKILLQYAYKYKHDDIIKILSIYII